MKKSKSQKEKNKKRKAKIQKKIDELNQLIKEDARIGNKEKKEQSKSYGFHYDDDKGGHHHVVWD